MAKVMIFDDDPDILDLCSLILKSRGYQTSASTDCNEILQKLHSFQPDVVLMDNWIPDTGGVEATRCIKRTASTAHIPVILFSASNEVKEKAEEAGADLFLRKPFDIDELEQIIRSALALNKQSRDVNSRKGELEL